MEEKENISSVKPKSLSLTFIEIFISFKKNKELFFLMPALIGGSIQLYYLLSIDIKFVRFFSVTQLVSDGLIFFISFIIIFIYYKLIFLFLSTLQYRLSLHNFKDSIIEYIIIFLVFLTFSVNLYSIYKESIIIFITSFISFLLLLISGEKLRNTKKITKKRSYIKYLFIFLILFLIRSSTFYIRMLNSPYFLNYINVSSHIEDAFPETKDSKILYYNDKYIFVEINYEVNNEKSKDIHVFKQDVFFYDFSKSKQLLKTIEEIEKVKVYNSKIDSLKSEIKKLENIH